MAQYFDDFEDGTVDTQPSGWTTRWVSSSGSWLLKTNSSIIWVEGWDTSNERGMLSFDAVDSDGDRDECEILVKFQSEALSSNTLYCGVVLRASGAATEETGYVVSLYNNDVVVVRYAAGTGTIVETSAQSLTADTWYWLRASVSTIDANTVRVTYKLWADGGSESSPIVNDSYDDTNATRVTTAGWIGLYQFATAADGKFDQVGVGTNGDAAPSSEPAGGATLLPSLFTDGDTFHAATVSVGAVTLTPALYSDADTFHAATVSQSGAPQTLTPDLYADGDTFHTPTVGRGAVTLTPSLYADGDTFHNATVAKGTVTLTPALFSDGDTFHTATVGRGAVTLTPALVSDGDTFYTHAVVLEGGPQTLSPELVVDGDTFHAATVTPGAVTLTPSLYTDPDTFHAAEVASGFNLQPPALADPDTFYPATVSGGAVTLAPQLFADGDTFYPATVANAGVQTLEPGLLTDADTFYVPTVTGGARTIGAARSAGRQMQTGARSNIQTNRR